MEVAAPAAMILAAHNSAFVLICYVVCVTVCAPTIPEQKGYVNNFFNFFEQFSNGLNVPVTISVLIDFSALTGSGESPSNLAQIFGALKQDAVP